MFSSLSHDADCHLACSLDLFKNTHFKDLSLCPSKFNQKNDRSLPSWVKNSSKSKKDRSPDEFKTGEKETCH